MIKIIQEPLLLPMPKRYTYFCRPLHNHPPTFKEGAKKVVLTKAIYYPDGKLMHDVGCEGVIIPVSDCTLMDLFESVHLFHTDYKKWKDCCLHNECRLDKVYDFFYYYTHKKTKKKRISIYHSYISLSDFKYL